MGAFARMPVVMELEYLLHHIAHAALATAEARNVARDTLNLWRCIAGAGGESYSLHGVVVWHIVAHVEHGLGGYRHLLAEISEGGHLIGHAEVDMLAAEHLKAGCHAPR